MTAKIEVIDVGGVETRNARTLERVAGQLEAPSRARGMFHVVGHGIPSASLEAFETSMRALFALPPDVKRSVRRTRANAWGYYDQELTKNRRDWKEIFDFGPEPSPGVGTASHSDGINQWPAGQAAIRHVLLRHYAACEALGRAILSALSVSLGMAPDRLDARFDGDSSFLRLNHYPPCPDPARANAPPLPASGQLGVHPHSDAGALTLLYQDEVPGLQVEDGDGFALVEPVEGALTVNLGDMLRVWSNDRYRSPVHRVLARSDRDRFSAPFFLNPRYDTVCEPLLEGSLRHAAPRFRPVSWARFRDRRSAGDFTDDGAEIQINDFLIAGTVASTQDAVHRPDDR